MTNEIKGLVSGDVTFGGDQGRPALDLGTATGTGEGGVGAAREGGDGVRVNALTEISGQREEYEEQALAEVLGIQQRELREARKLLLTEGVDWVMAEGAVRLRESGLALMLEGLGLAARKTAGGALEGLGVDLTEVRVKTRLAATAEAGGAEKTAALRARVTGFPLNKRMVKATMEAGPEAGKTVLVQVLKGREKLRVGQVLEVVPHAWAGVYEVRRGA